MYNEHTLDWDDEIIAYAGITKDQLPPVVSTTYSKGLSDTAAKALRLPEGLPVVIGATDASWSTSASVPSNRDRSAVPSVPAALFAC